LSDSPDISISARGQKNRLIEMGVRFVLILCALVAVVTTVGIVASLLFEALRFFQKVPLTDFLFGLEWSPQTALRSDQVGSSGAFGAVPLIAGTLLISAIAMIVATPLGLMSAVYLAEYASDRTRGIIKPLLELLAGIPTVVYGFFALTFITPFLRDWARRLREAAYGLGGTKFDVAVKVVVPAALSGIVSAFLLAIARAVGETMIVAMAAGARPVVTPDPTEQIQTMTGYITQVATGDVSNFEIEYYSIYAVAMTLFVITLGLTLLGNLIRARFRESYQ